jgi:hypothetical protein
MSDGTTNEPVRGSRFVGRRSVDGLGTAAVWPENGGRMRVMRNFFAMIALGLLLATLPASSEDEVLAPAAPSAAADPHAREIAEYEAAMGKNHGLTRDQILQRMGGFMSNPVFKNRFLGILTLQSPTDAWIVMEIMHEVKPDLIVEAGTFHGGSAAFWATIL